MCDRIYNRDTGQEVESVNDLRALVGQVLFSKFEPNPDPGDCCLCNTDHEAILKAAGYDWQPVNGDTTDIVIKKRPTP